MLLERDIAQKFCPVKFFFIFREQIRHTKSFFVVTPHFMLRFEQVCNTQIIIKDFTFCRFFDDESLIVL